MEARRQFRDVIKSRAIEAAKPVDEFLQELDGVIAQYSQTKDKVVPAIGNGTASRAVIRKLAMEFYYLGKWMTPEFAIFIANAPDTDALSLDASEHYLHWAQNFADEAGYLGDPNHVQMKVEFCQQLGISAEELERYVPLPETIAVTFTHLYYIRRSYEEGLATFGYAGERLAAKSGYAKVLYEGLKKHYGLEVKNFAVHAYAEPDHGEKAAELLRKVVTTAYVQRRCREAVRNCMMVKEARVRAMNAWVE